MLSHLRPKSPRDRFGDGRIRPGEQPSCREYRRSRPTVCLNVLHGFMRSVATVDILVASLIFTEHHDHVRAVGEMFRVWKPGGRCFIADPRYAFWASIPLMAMWLLASVIHSGNGYREARKATVLKTEAFSGLFRQLPWKAVRIWQDGRYQYALCEKN